MQWFYWAHAVVLFSCEQCRARGQIQIQSRQFMQEQKPVQQWLAATLVQVDHLVVHFFGLAYFHWSCTRTDALTHLCCCPPPCAACSAWRRRAWAGNVPEKTLRITRAVCTTARKAARPFGPSPSHTRANTRKMRFAFELYSLIVCRVNEHKSI